MARITTPRHAFLFGPDPHSVLDAEDSSSVPHDPFPGELVAHADNAGNMEWAPVGEYDAASPTTVTLTIRDGGAIAGRASFVQEVEDVVYGWDEVTRITDTDVVDWDTGGTANGSFDVVATVNGFLVAVTATDASSSTRSVRLFTRAPGGAWTLRGLILSPDGASHAANLGAWPTLAVDDDGTVYLAVVWYTHVGYEGSNSRAARVALYEAPPDADWTTQPFELADGSWAQLQTVTTTGVQHLALGVGGGERLLFWQTSGTAGRQHYDRGTGDLEGPLDLGTTDRMTVRRHQGAWLVAWYNTDAGPNELRVARLGRADQSLLDADYTELAAPGSSGVDGYAPPVLITRPDAAWVMWTDTGVPWGSVSTDGGVTWSTPVQLDEGWSDAVGWRAGCEWRGRGVVLHRASGPPSAKRALVQTSHGGWTTHPLARDVGVAGGRLLWTHAWRALTGAAFDGWNISETGTPAKTYGTGSRPGWFIEVGAGEDFFADVDVSGAYTATCHAMEITHEVTFGTAVLHCRLSGSGCTVTATPTTLEFEDLISGATVSAPLTGSARHQVLLVLREVGGAVEATALYRIEPSGSSEASAFAELVADRVLTAGALVDLWHYEIPESSEAIVETASWYQGGAEASWTPSVPYGRPVQPVPVYVRDGVGVACIRGPAVAGDSWTMAPSSLHPIEAAFFTPAYMSRRSTARVPASAGSMTVAWSHPGSAYFERGWPGYALYIETNAPLMFVSRKVAGSYTTLLTHPHRVAVEGTVAGRDVWLSASSSGSAPYLWVEEDELAGGCVTLDTGTVLRILGNTAGVLRGVHAVSGEEWRVASLRVDAGHDGEVVTHVSFPRLLHVVQQAALGGDQGLRVQLAGAPADADYYELKILAGPIYPLIHMHGRDTVTAYEPQYDEAEADGGFRVRRPRGPMQQIVELSWQDCPDVWPIQTRDTSRPPDHVAPAGYPTWSRGETASTIRALVERWAASGQPIGYCGRWDVDPDSLGATYLHLRARGTVIGTIDGPWSVEHGSYGDEMRDEVLVPGRLRLRTVP